MRRGTTCKLVFSVPFDTGEIEILNIAFEQNKRLVLEKNTDQCILGGETIAVELTEEETLSLKGDITVKFQIRAKMKDGRVIASNIMQSTVREILKDGVLE